jgi:hypothetical protein
LWEQAREYERRTFSNIAVTGSTGVKLLEVSPLPEDPTRSLVCIRDYADDDLLKNDTTAGWGLAAPRNGMPAYPASPTVDGLDTTFAARWMFAGFMYSPNVEWSYMHGTSDATSTAVSECRMEYGTTLTGPWTTVADSTNQTTWFTLSGTPPTTVSGQFTVSLATSGQFFAIRLVQRRVSGGPFHRTLASPVYLNAL